MTEADGKPRARLALPYRRTPALICHRRNATCPAWPSAASALPGVSLFRHRLLLARAIAGAPPVEHPPARGTMPCAPGPFLRTRASENHRGEWKRPWCARERRQSHLNQRSSGHSEQQPRQQSGARRALRVICTPKVGQKTFGYAYKTWNERKANVCQHAQRRIYC